MPDWLRLRGIGCANSNPATSSVTLTPGPVISNVIWLTTMEYDSLQFAWDIEDRFDIALLPADAERLTTVGELCDYLSRRATMFFGSTCPSATAFYFTRKELAGQTGIKTKALRPDTRLQGLWPENELRDGWTELGNSIGTKLPWLQWTWRMRSSFFSYLLFCLSLFVLTLYLFESHLLAIVLGASTTTTLSVAGYCCAVKFARTVPASVATLGDLARWLALHHYMKADCDPSEIDDWVWSEVSDILYNKLELEPHSLTREMRFQRDLCL
jgi:hypothetical protein